MKRLRVPAAAALLAGALSALDARYPWAWAYLADRLRPQAAQAAAGPTHVLFTFVDHFEPHDQEAVDRWARAYPEMARRHHDADGRVPQHTWFWSFSHSDGEESLRFLRQLSRLSHEGFGEVEMHLHHDHDTEQTLSDRINRMIQLSQWTGAMVTAEPSPRTTFGFIHGLWGLDNSRGVGACGVNSELLLLKRLGCYADFTHPSWGRMHPRVVNRLYYAADDPRRPKSYDTGTALRAGSPPTGDLLMFEGPSVVRWRGWRPVYDHGDVTMEDLPTPDRIDAWVRAGIHVEGRPEWVFVKVFTHGAVARDHEAVLGAWRERMHEHLEGAYNDGTRYALHYVTAREAYNIAKAAEAGKDGDPGAYRDFLIPPYANRYLAASVPYELLRKDGERLIVRFLSSPGTMVEASIAAPQVDVAGDAEGVSVESSSTGSRVAFTTAGDGLVEFILQPSAFALGGQPHG